jgi:hypothetical protein
MSDLTVNGALERLYIHEKGANKKGVIDRVGDRVKGGTLAVYQ